MEKDYSKYLGRQFNLGETDCYGLIRDFYKDQFQIELTNYARPENFWAHEELSLYEKNIRKEGFKRIDFEDVKTLKLGDILLASIRTVNPCHGLIYIGKGQVLHHFTNTLSCISPYSGTWRNATMSAYRHPKVKQDEQVIRKELMDDVRIRNVIEIQKRGA